METHIVWRIGLYIFITIGLIYLAFTQHGDQKKVKKVETALWGFMATPPISLCYLSLLGIAILYFQPLDNPNLRSLYLSLTIYIALTCTYYIVDYLNKFTLNPIGKPVIDAGVMITTIVSSIPDSYYGCGVAITIIHSLGLLQ